jgi:hypothetical protein
VRVSMPIGAPSLVEPGGTVTPMGVRTLDWMRELVSASDAEQHERAAGFFPWWERGFTASACLGLGLHLAWACVAWHPPADEAERQVLRLALEALERAAAFGASIPEQETTELRALLKKERVAVVPREEGIGYLRHPVRHHLPTGWSLEVPGYWYSEAERDGTQVFRWGDLEVRLTAFRAGPGVPGGKDALTRQEPRRQDRLAWFTREEDGLYGTAEVAAEQEGGGSPWILVGEVVVGADLCLVTVSFSRREDLARAEAVWRSLRYPRETPA